MSKKHKDVTDAEIVDIKTGKSVATVPLDRPNPQPDLEDKEDAAKALAEAELQAKLKVEEDAREEQRLADLQVKLDAALKQHQEKASLAFELLKSIMSQKTETVLAGTAFNLLIKNVYRLTDTFKQEVDDRWTKEVTELTQSVKPTDESNKTVN